MTADADLFKLGTEPVKSRKAATLGEAGYERRPRDAYFTPGWVTRALVKYIDFHPVTGGDPGLIWEPAVGDGRIADVLRAAGYDVVGSDIHDYGWSGDDPRAVIDCGSWARLPLPDRQERTAGGVVRTA